MENELKMCKEILKKVKWYMERKDYSGLRLYIEEREKYVENCRIMSKNKEEEYIDSLVKELDISNTQHSYHILHNMVKYKKRYL